MREAPRAPRPTERRISPESKETRVYTFQNPIRENVDGSNSFEGQTWKAEITLHLLSAVDRINAFDGLTNTLRRAEYVFIAPNGTRINAFHALGRDPIPLYIDTSSTDNTCRTDINLNREGVRIGLKVRNIQVSAVDSVHAARVLLHEIAHSAQTHDTDYINDWLLHYNHKRLKQEQAESVLSPFALTLGQRIQNHCPEVSEAWEVAKRTLPIPPFFTPVEVNALKEATITERKKYYAHKVGGLEELRRQRAIKGEEFDRILARISAPHLKEARRTLNRGILNRLETNILNEQEQLRLLEPFLLILNAREHVLMYPEKRLERDAWKRAILSMRGLRSMGIDLFGETNEGEVTAFSHVNNCLDGYDATQGQMIRHTSDPKTLPREALKTSDFFEEKKAA